MPTDGHFGHPECCHAPACMWCVYCGPTHYNCYPRHQPISDEDLEWVEELLPTGDGNVLAPMEMMQRMATRIRAAEQQLAEARAQIENREAVLVAFDEKGCAERLADANKRIAELEAKR